MRFTWWFYFAKCSTFAVLILFIALFIAPSSTFTEYLAYVVIAYVIIAGICGALLGAILILWQLKMRCPFCDKYGFVSGNKQQGMHMVCDDCGYVHGTGLFGFKIVCEKEEQDERDDD